MLRVVLLFISLSASLHAQDVHVVFTPMLGSKAFDLGGAGAGAEKVGKGNGVIIEVLRFYLSDVTLHKYGVPVHRATKKHHLLDAERPETMRLSLSTTAGYDELRFTLGVDSLTAASGAFGGDLDPTNGMYWTWRSGYINFKLEGTSPNCPARKNRFQFHVGGFQAPFNSEREVRLRVSPGEDIQVAVDLDRLFYAVDLTTEYQIMSPNSSAANLADKLVGLFYLRR